MATIKTNATNSINDMNIKFEMLIKQLTDDAVSAGNNFIAEEHLLPTLAIYSKFHTKKFLLLSTMLSKQVGKKIGLTMTVIIVAVTRTKVMPSLRSIAPSHNPLLSPLRLWFSRGRTKFLKWKPSYSTEGLVTAPCHWLLGEWDPTGVWTAARQCFVPYDRIYHSEVVAISSKKK